MSGTRTSLPSATPARPRTQDRSPRFAKQAPVVVENLDSFFNGRPLAASYDGYASCPIVTSSQAMLLAEFDYSMTMKPTFPGLDPAVPHRSYWYLKKYGLPFLYWNLMLKGLA